jgi:hypothetical protein
MNAILVNKAFKKNSLTTPKAEAAYDLEGLAVPKAKSGLFMPIYFIYVKVRITFKNDDHIVKCV